ncbi:hypothetical protein AcdelDRAFT_2508 [Acidovorax delafieldii 2AN]|uniref:Uncharacterized protein n=1 Tax=Acidovorax delafieldii 2AN TaxID=573060 RepID=C5T6H8_ACIDE|nr:hypothetical protein [Acidovorax delafieldii]EER59922.1 hypothetical protein AcdelDRAFT_2508 [Acidovorax delafieldii 2AN]
MQWVTHLTLLTLNAVNAYLIFRRDWDPMDAWRFVAGAAIAVLLTLLLHLLLLVRPEERTALLRELAKTAKADLDAFLKLLRFWR